MNVWKKSRLGTERKSFFYDNNNECWEKIKADNKRRKQLYFDNKANVAARAKQYRLDNKEHLKKKAKQYKVHNGSVFGSLCHLYKAM